MSEYPPLHCRAGRHGRVLAADTGSVLQRLELDVCLSAGAATGLQSGPSTQPAGHQTVTWQSAESCRHSHAAQDTRMTVSQCHPTITKALYLFPPSPSDNPHPHNVDWRQHKVRCEPPLAVTAAESDDTVWPGPGAASQRCHYYPEMCLLLQSVLSAAL